MKDLIKSREEALAAHKLAQTRMMERQRTTFIPFKKGDKVWLDTRYVKKTITRRSHRKKKDRSKS